MVLAAFLLIVVAGCLAFAIDVGYICLVRTQAQAAADSAALAAGQVLVNEERLRGAFDATYGNARQAAAEFAALNQVGPHAAALDADDVEFGRLENTRDLTAVLDSSNPAAYNAVAVRVLATAARGRQVPLFFGPIFGKQGADVEATATVAFADRISGFRIPSDTPDATAPLLPFTLQVDDWRDLAAAGGSDQFAYDPQTRSVTAGADGVPEAMLFPISQGAGNWGTVDIGDSNNSAADLKRQIRDGVSAGDLAVHGGSLELNPTTGSLTLNGDTGISAGIKDALDAIVGQPKAIPLYRTASGQGNNRNFEIVGFAGVRIMEVALTGNDKRLIIQPAYVVDSSAIAASGSSDSYFIVKASRLVR